MTYVVKVTTDGGADGGTGKVIGNENQVWESNRDKHMKDTMERVIAHFKNIPKGQQELF